MPLDTYANLQASILSWLARPGDPLVSPSIPDIIQLFEHEATRRLKVGGAEKRASLTALSAAVALPADFGELRLATSGGVILTYVTPMQLPDGGGPPAHYTIIGNEMRLGPSPSGGCTVEIVYQSGVPPLSDTNTSNWLLTAHPDCYLFGSLVEAESFIGSDERIPLWAQRREAAFASIETADRKARWGGAPLSIRAEGVSGGNGTAAGDWTSAPPVPIPIAAIVAGDGLTGGGTEGIVTVALSTPVAVSRGGTGAATAADARLNLGAAPIDSPALSGNPTAPTPAPGDADTSIATTAFVGAALSAQALAGDVTGPTNTTAVVRLQGHPVAATAPTSLQVLQWSGTNWAPATIAAGGTLTGVTAGTGITVSGAAPSPTVALTVPVSVANGGTGSTTAPAALTALGAVAKAGDTMTGALVVRTNAAALPAPPAGTVLQAGGTDANPARIVVDAFGGGSNNPMLQFRSAGGTAATRTPTQSGDTLGNIIWQGYGTTGIPAGGKAQLAAFATQAWTDAATGTGMNFIVTANGGTTSAEAMRIDHNGNVGIGGTPLRKLHVFAGNTAGVVGEAISAGVNGADSTTIMLNLMDGTSAVAVGAINRTGTNSVAYATTSDERLKDDIRESERGLDALMAIRVSDYRMGDTHQQGLLAQDIAEVYPEAVHVGGDDPALAPWMIDYGRLTPLLIRTIQQQQEQLADLSAKVAALEGKPA